MTFGLLSMSPTSGFVCNSCWVWGLDRMSCLVSWGLEEDRVLCTSGLPRTWHIISGSASSCFSIWRWRAEKKPGLLVFRPRLSRPSTVGEWRGQVRWRTAEENDNTETSGELTLERYFKGISLLLYESNVLPICYFACKFRMNMLPVSLYCVFISGYHIQSYATRSSDNLPSAFFLTTQGQFSVWFQVALDPIKSSWSEIIFNKSQYLSISIC